MEMEKCDLCEVESESIERFIGRDLCKKCSESIEDGDMCYCCGIRDNNCRCDYCGLMRFCPDCSDTSRKAEDLYFCFDSDCIDKYLWKNGMRVISSDEEY